MDFWRTRGLAYFIGAFEFADNVRLNILDALHLSRNEQLTSRGSSLTGRV
jgi:hypothetical protein